MKFTMKKLGKAVLTAALVGVVAAVLAGCGKQSDSAAGGGDGQKKVVNVAFTNYYVPYDFVNDKGEPDGFEVAVMQEVAKKLPQYTWKFTPTSDDDLLIGVAAIIKQHYGITDPDELRKVTLETVAVIGKSLHA